MTARQPGPASKLPPGQCAIAAAKIRVLRQRNGWSQAYLGELMGRPAPPPCAPPKRQRRFGRWEIEQLAAIFGVPVWQLLTRCATCGGQPPPGYSSLACKAEHPAGPSDPESLPAATVSR